MTLIFIYLFVILFVLVVLIISASAGVPFLPTNYKRAKQMMDLAEIKTGSRVVDLGSGAGRLLFLAAARGATATGYELNPILCWWTQIMIFLKGYKGKVKIHCQSLYDADLSNTDVVFTFLLNGPMKKLDNKLFTELPSGAKIVSYLFSIPNRTPIKKENGIIVYQV